MPKYGEGLQLDLTHLLGRHTHQLGDLVPTTDAAAIESEATSQNRSVPIAQLSEHRVKCGFENHLVESIFDADVLIAIWRWHGTRLAFIFDDAVAQPDAPVADVDARSGDQLPFGLETEGTPHEPHVVSVWCCSSG